MAIAALMSKKINRPVMHRISRIEEYGIGSARPSFQGHVKLGFARRRQDARRRPLHRAGKRPAYRRRRFPLRRQRALDGLSAAAMRWRAVPVLTNTPPVGPQRGPGENQFVAVFEPMIDKAARELGIDRLAIRQHQRARQRTQDRCRPGSADQRLPEGRARQGRGDVQLGRAQEEFRPAQRHQGDRHRHRPGLSLGRHQRLRRPGADHAGRQAARPYRRRQSRHLLPLGDRPCRGRYANYELGQRDHRARR